MFIIINTRSINHYLDYNKSIFKYLIIMKNIVCIYPSIVDVYEMFALIIYFLEFFLDFL